MRLDRLAKRYRGDAARKYDARRASQRKWIAEQEAMDRLLGGLPPKTSLLDIPFGTGRFVDLYNSYDLRAMGMDISRDMLRAATTKLDTEGIGIALAMSDIRSIPVANRSFDGAVCIRFLNWVDESALKAAMAELCRVSRRHIIVGIRHYAPLANMKPLYSPPNLKRLLLQLRARMSNNNGLVIHEKSYIVDTFRRYQLKVRETEWIESRGDGTEYVIYHLVKGSDTRT